MENVFPGLCEFPDLSEFSKLKYGERKELSVWKNHLGTYPLGSTERVASPRDHVTPFLFTFSIVSPCNVVNSPEESCRRFSAFETLHAAVDGMLKFSNVSDSDCGFKRRFRCYSVRESVFPSSINPLLTSAVPRTVVTIVFQYR